MVVANALAEIADGASAFVAGMLHVLTHFSVLLACLKRMPLLALCVVATASTLWAALLPARLLYLAAGAARPAAVSYASILGATALPFFRVAQVIVPFFGGGAKGPFWASLAALPPRSVPPAAARHDPTQTP